MFIPHDQEEAELMSLLDKQKITKKTINTEKNEYYKNIFRSATTKSKPMSLRMRPATIIGLKERAEKTGVPYQIILEALATQYVWGKIDLKL